MTRRPEMARLTGRTVESVLFLSLMENGFNIKIRRETNDGISRKKETIVPEKVMP